MKRALWTEKTPFQVVDRKVNGAHAGYDIYCKNRPFLRQVAGQNGIDATDVTPRLKRHEAYAIAKLINAEKSLRKWAEKFGDPYE